MQHLSSIATATAAKTTRPLTPFQERTLTALNDGALGSTHVNESPTLEGPGFWRVTMFAAGVFCLVGGVTLIFFLTALGAGLSLLGGVTCLMAYERGSFGKKLPGVLASSQKSAARSQAGSLH